MTKLFTFRTHMWMPCRGEKKKKFFPVLIAPIYIYIYIVQCQLPINDLHYQNTVRTSNQKCSHMHVENLLTTQDHNEKQLNTTNVQLNFIFRNYYSRNWFYSWNRSNPFFLHIQVVNWMFASGIRKLDDILVGVM